MFIICAFIFGAIAAALVSAVGFDFLAWPAGIVGFLWCLFIGSAFGMSIRIGKGMWLHFR
jgi:hypothetical protein